MLLQLASSFLFYNAITFHIHNQNLVYVYMETSRRYFALDSLLLSSTYSLSLCHGAIKMKIYCHHREGLMLLRGFKSFYFFYTYLVELSAMLLQCKISFLLLFLLFLVLFVSHFPTFPISFRNFLFPTFSTSSFAPSEMEIIWVLIINDWKRKKTWNINWR